MDPQLQWSYRECQRVAREAASNFRFAFTLLPKEQRRSMFALYAFLRKTDDLCDGAESIDWKRSRLAQWRDSLDAAFHGEGDDPRMPALVDTLGRFDIPVRLLHEVIDGCEMDLEIDRYETFADLEVYCHRVASAVGLACIRIWGFQGEEAMKLATECGVALQLTNILRDLREDASRGRIYLPREDLARFDYSEEELLAGVLDARYDRLVRFEVERAEGFYQQAARLNSFLPAAGRRVCGAMVEAYHRLLQEIDRHPRDVFDRRISLSRRQKLGIALRWGLAGRGKT